VDSVWDRQVFDRAETFGGAEIRFARALSGSILARLLGVEYAALASVASANIGEVLALLGPEQTVKNAMPESYQEQRKKILLSLPGYQAARAYLLSYDRLEDVPLRGVDRTQPPDAERLLLFRERAPAFGVLLAAFGNG
jgi:hypothetical protein